MGVELKKVKVRGVSMAFRQFGSGDQTMVFVHGMPTSSYIWRNIMNQMPEGVRCIAVDLIGMGDSDQPNIGYTVQDHIDYFKGFMDVVCPGVCTLVLHGWGSVMGLDFMRQCPERVSGVALYEGYIKAVNHWDGLSLPVQELAADLSGENAARRVLEDNYLIERFLPAGVMGGLNPDVLEVYRRPFVDHSSRKVLLQYVMDAPVGRPNSASLKVVRAYETMLLDADIPKLLLYAVPGFTTTIETVAWSKNFMRRITLVDLGEAYHFAQETCPRRFSNGLFKWYEQNVLENH